MSGEHTCPECGIDRTEILARNCPTCHEWADALDQDYETWRGAQ